MVNRISFIILIVIVSGLLGCSSDPDVRDDDDGYEDGTYCAQVKYYYSETGTNSTYTLMVEIEDGDLVKIKWPNGGWLDDSHFTPPDIQNGSAEFTSDRGVEYSVTILGDERTCSVSRHADDEDDLIQEKEDEELKEKRKQEEDEHEEEQRVSRRREEEEKAEQEQREDDDRKRREDEDRKKEEE